jgi:hypothetical protein
VPTPRIGAPPLAPMICKTAGLYILKAITLLLGHRLHRRGNAADAVAGLAPPSEWHPVGSERRVVIDHHGRSVEALSCIERSMEILRIPFWPVTMIMGIAPSRE